MVRDCEMDTDTWTMFPRLVSIYDSKGNIEGMRHVPISPPLAPVVPSIPWVKAAHQVIHRNLGALILEDPYMKSSGSENNCEV